MNRGLLLKSAREAAVQTALLSVALLVIEAIFSYVLPTYLQEFSGQLLRIEFFQSMIRALLGTEIGDLIGPDAFFAIAWVHPVVLAIVWTQAIVFCTRVPAGEIDRGTIDVFFGLPVSRWRVYLVESGVFMATGVILLTMGLLGHRLGALAVTSSERPTTASLLIVVVNFYCLFLAVGGIAFLVSAVSDRRGRAVGTVFAILLASFLLNFLAQFWAPAQYLSFLSVLNYYQPLVVLRAGGDAWPIGDIAVLTITAVTLWTAGGIHFARRDLCTV